MTEDEKQPSENEDAENEDAPPDSEAGEETAAEEGGQPEAGAGETAEEAVEELTPEQQVEELNDKMLRALAEAENVRRRAERDRSDAAKYAITNFAREVLGVADNMKRAMASVDSEARKKDPALEQLFPGRARGDVPLLLLHVDSHRHRLASCPPRSLSIVFPHDSLLGVRVGGSLSP